MAVDTVVALHAALGASVVRCRAAEHDDAVAIVSHLPYLVASALASAANEAARSRTGSRGQGSRT